ncbi:MAG: endonuclease/exonuclease/phosphatase family protein [Rhodospirillaceae bacterium]|nr:endonuclease/exonuclease/phosphatase family protein [Rhodospirillaceae bacterium]
MRAVSYNIQWGCGRDGVVDLARVTRTIADADIIALQEVERNWKPEHGDEAAILSSLLPKHHWTYIASVDLDGSTVAPDGTVTTQRRQYGQMTLSRWPISSVRSWSLSKYPVYGQINDQSVVLETVVECPGHHLRVYNTHLNYLMQDQRMRQVEELRRIVEQAPRQGPVVSAPGVDPIHLNEDWLAMDTGRLPTMPDSAILMGDFNMRVNSPEYRRMVGSEDPTYGRGSPSAEHFADSMVVAGHPVEEGCTYPDFARDEFKRIDYCFLSFDLIPHVRRSWIDADADASDHQPVWTELEIGA